MTTTVRPMFMLSAAVCLLAAATCAAQQPPALLPTSRATAKLWEQYKDIDFVCFSPDGKLLALVGGDNRSHISIVQWPGAEVVKELKAPEHVSLETAAFSPDGSLLASQYGNTIALWDVKTGAVLRQTAEGTWGKAFAFSPDGTTLAAGTSNGMALYDVASAKVIADKLNPTNGEADYATIAYTPDGSTVAGTGNIAQIYLHDGKTGKFLKTIGELKNQHCRAIAISPDGRTLAACRDRDVLLLDLASGAQRSLVRPGMDTFWSLAFSPDGKTLAVGGFPQTIFLFDLPAGTPRARLMEAQREQRWIESLAWSADGLSIVTTSGHATGKSLVKVWDVSPYPPSVVSPKQ